MMPIYIIFSTAWDPDQGQPRWVRKFHQLKVKSKPSKPENPKTQNPSSIHAFQHDRLDKFCLLGALFSLFLHLQLTCSWACRPNTAETKKWRFLKKQRYLLNRTLWQSVKRQKLHEGRCRSLPDTCISLDTLGGLCWMLLGQPRPFLRNFYNI